MRKCFFLILFLLGGLAAMSQQAPRPLPQVTHDHDMMTLRQRFRELNLDAAQRRRLLVLFRRYQQQQQLNRRELNEILTDEQKKKLLHWKEEKEQNKKDSANKNN